MFVTMQGLGISIKNIQKMKELGKSESIIKEKKTANNRLISLKNEGSGRNILIKEEKFRFILELMKKNTFISVPKIIKNLLRTIKILILTKQIFEDF